MGLLAVRAAVGVVVLAVAKWGQSGGCQKARRWLSDDCVEWVPLHRAPGLGNAASHGGFCLFL